MRNDFAERTRYAQAGAPRNGQQSDQQAAQQANEGGHGGGGGKRNRPRRRNNGSAPVESSAEVPAGTAAASGGPRKVNTHGGETVHVLPGTNGTPTGPPVRASSIQARLSVARVAFGPCMNLTRLFADAPCRPAGGRGHAHCVEATSGAWRRCAASAGSTRPSARSSRSGAGGSCALGGGPWRQRECACGGERWIDAALAPPAQR